MKFAAYCRVSTERGEQLTSLENQKLFFSEYAQKTGDELVRIYADKGISGKDMKKRDAFLEMLAEAETGAFDYVAVKDISRFARNTSDFLYGIRKLKSFGTDVRFLSNNQTVLGESEFVLTVFAALAQQESENLSKRVVFGKRQNAKKGRVPNVVYGYDREDMYNLKINTSEGETVKLMFRMYLSGEGTRRIAMRLNEMGIPTKKGAMWQAKTVRRILQNPIYTGRLTNNKSVTEDFLSGKRRALPEEEWFVHERPMLRLISDADFYSVQKKIAGRREMYDRKERFSGKYLFSNVIKCGECGGSFTARENSGVRYRCAAHNNGLCKNAVTVKEQDIKEEVERYLESRNIKCADRAGSSDLERIDKLEKSLKNRKKRFMEMYAAELIGMERLKSELSAVNKRIEEIKRDIPSETQEEKYSNEDIRSAIKKIVVYSDKSIKIYGR